MLIGILLDPLWDELIEHNQDIREELRHRTSSRLIDATYGSMGRQRHSLLETAVSQDQVDAATASASVEVLTATARDEQVQLLQVKKYHIVFYHMPLRIELIGKLEIIIYLQYIL